MGTAELGLNVKGWSLEPLKQHEAMANMASAVRMRISYKNTLSTSLYTDGTEEISSSRIQESIDQGRSCSKVHSTSLSLDRKSRTTGALAYCFRAAQSLDDPLYLAIFT